jgi:hypothetical protein
MRLIDNYLWLRTGTQALVRTVRNHVFASSLDSQAMIDQPLLQQLPRNIVGVR